MIKNKGSALSTIMHFLLRNKVHHFDKLLENASIEVTSRQFHLLRHIFRNNGCTQQEISATLCKDKTLITRMIGTLSKRGLLERRSDKLDGRKKRIFLTKQGEELRDELMDIYFQHELQMIKGIDKDELDNFIITAKKIMKNCQTADNYTNLEKNVFPRLTTNLSELGYKQDSK